MKKISSLLIASMLSIVALAQSPEMMSYQAVVRDAGDNLVAATTIGMQISILQDSINGAAVYVETHAPTTNINGLVSLEIGAGSNVVGTFNAIDWSSGTYFIKTETDPTGGTSYTITGTSQLLSVPYALFAKNSSGWQTIDDTTHTLNQVGIGTASSYPGVELVLSDDVFSSQVIETSGTTTDAELWLKNPKGVWRMHGDQSDGNKLKFGLWTDYSEAGGSNILSNALTIDTLGNVGIGTAFPKANLHIFKEDSVVLNIQTNSNGASGAYLRLNEDQQGTGGFIRYKSSGLNSNTLRLGTATIGGGDTDMIILRRQGVNGIQVGINIDNPQQILHVNDVMRLEPRSTAPANPSKGDIYMDDSSDKLMVYDGSIWQACW